jgi:FkbM family methyltransferase
MSSLQQAARRFLPASVRKPVGYAAGLFNQTVIRTIKGAIFDLAGGRFRADSCEFVIPKDITSMPYRSCFLDSSYEAEERDMVRDFVRPEDTVLEVGACLGIVSCVTNKLLLDKSRHVVVEGNPYCIPTLYRNRELNQCEFLIENCAVSTRRDATFYLHPVYVVGGTTQRESSRPVRVPACSLAELDTRHGPFSALIMDIEGGELEAFLASAEVLKRYRLVIAELHPWALGDEGVDKCRQLLLAAGLRFKRRAGITEAWERKS